MSVSTSGQTESPKVFLITGCSRGFGRTFVQQILAAGHHVMATAREVEKLSTLESTGTGKLARCPLDITSVEQCHNAVNQTVEEFGRLDVLVNNAGYGLFAAWEETTAEQARRNIETNFLGPMNVTKAAIPVFRQQRSGQIINMSAIAAYGNEMGFSIYGGAKAALDTAMDALRGELSPWKVNITAVIPGPFRTEFISPSMDETSTPMPEYAKTSGKFGAFLKTIAKQQPGDPVKAAKVLLELTLAESPPKRIVLGEYACPKYKKLLESRLAEHIKWEELGRPTDFDSVT